MNGKTILITGVNGFIGRWAAERLQQGNRILGLSRDGAAPAGVVGVQGDITAMDRLRVKGPVDYCIHLAAISDVQACDRDPLQAFRSNVQGTSNVLQWCSAQGVRGLLLASSGKVYGSGPGTVREDAIPRPYNMYGITKAYADYLAQGYGRLHRLPVLSMRLVNVYGPGDPNSSRIIPSTIRSLREGVAPVLYGDGSTERAFLYVTDVVSFIERALSALEQGNGGIYNVSPPSQYSIRTIVETIVRLMASSLQPRYQEGKAVPSDCILLQDKARALGWEPQVPLEEGLRQVIAAS
ncbi:MAG: NAD(P)-dependent oxidoreductase [Candidatus Aenigmarchaeota archaeon]|nr:NAD(P)-dependent oxidoreductase [Candidatus Aenigmarchaeota archaeon]